ncbi:MAG: hypothetical protein Fur002_22300 [Anaerolineales bacterium]
MLTENLIKVGVALLAGGLIGAEREFQDKAAGFRTIILITVGSALFTIFSMSIAPLESSTRIAANIVTGIGFLGAGAIVRDGGKIGGLTTAAAIWLASALGMGIGAGELFFSIAATLVALTVLLAFPRIEALIGKAREARTYRITVKMKNYAKIAQLDKALRKHAIKIIEHHQSKDREHATGIWKTIGFPKNQDAFARAAIKDKSVEKLEY